MCQTQTQIWNNWVLTLGPSTKNRTTNEPKTIDNELSLSVVPTTSQLYIFWIITYSNECQQKVLFYVFSSFTFHYLNFEFEFSDTFSRTLVRNKCYTHTLRNSQQFYLLAATVWLWEFESNTLKNIGNI